MDILIGSARIDERSKLSGGNAGDQKQIATPDYKGEVSMQSFYMHKKGWVILRAKNPTHAYELANIMERACNNPNIGYDQNQRLGIIKYGTLTKTKTDCDCSSLVRECVIEATGTDPGNFTTANEVSALLYTKLFDRVACNNAADVKKGDILVTKTKGHTAIVVADNNSTTVYPTLRRGSRGAYVKEMQTLLNYSSCGAHLVVDGVFGSLSEIALISFQKMRGLRADGICGKKTWAELKR